jgi:hypothetical protein
MNKLFAFLCVNTMVFTLNGEESIESNTTATRGLDFGLWSKFTQDEERSETERRLEEAQADEEEAEGNTDE